MLTLNLLYMLFGEPEEAHHFLRSATATSVYEAFLLQVAWLFLHSCACLEHFVKWHVSGGQTRLTNHYVSQCSTWMSWWKVATSSKNYSNNWMKQGKVVHFLWCCSRWNCIWFKPRKWLGKCNLFAAGWQALHHQPCLLVQTIATSSNHLLDIISMPPNGSEGCVTHVLTWDAFYAMPPCILFAYGCICKCSLCIPCHMNISSSRVGKIYTIKSIENVAKKNLRKNFILFET